MVNKELVNDELTKPHINTNNKEELFFFSLTNTYSSLLSRVKGEYVNKVLTNYARGPVARKVIEYVVDNIGWTIPTISHDVKVPNRQTIDQILKKLRPWVVQTRVRLQHPVKAPGNRAYVWMRHDAESSEAVNYARKRYYSTLLVDGPVEVEEPEIIYEMSRKGQELAEVWINYFMREDRLHLNPSPGELKRNINRDAPDISLEERDLVTRHILSKVAELREASE